MREKPRILIDLQKEVAVENFSVQFSDFLYSSSIDFSRLDFLRRLRFVDFNSIFFIIQNEEE